MASTATPAPQEPDSVRFALQEGGLVYSADDMPGITRRKAGKAFCYIGPDGRVIRDRETISRIRALAIPPAYEQVWICPDPRGHIQATGRDQRGRKQYRYHPDWTSVRNANKYEQLLAFALALPRIRRRVARDMKAGAPADLRIIAVVVRLLEATLIRIGQREYAVANKSFGLTTLRRRHASVAGDRVRFRFRGKSGIRHDVTIRDRRIARAVKRCMEIPGHELFQYVDAEGDAHRVDSGQVNAYLKETGGGEFTAKHYRTWAASVFALEYLQKRDLTESSSRRAIVNEAVKATAALLGNTAAVCRACYIHPALIDAALAGELPAAAPAPGPCGLRAAERRLLAFLQAR